MANDQKNTGSNKSGTTRAEYLKQIGGVPAKKTVEQIETANDPKARGKAPGSVRV